ncbi:MAG: low temperature requirement protein A [Rhodoblastus sp.]|nr:low temperature requirement protein A [Rhodoblastus sp.]
MRGRDKRESHRAASPLELLFDLTFVIGFGNAASQLAHQLAEGHYGAGLLAFTIAIVAVCWAWINYSWFSSAYDTDDWIFRLATMVQMVGVIILSLGIPRLFESFSHGDAVDNRVMTLGYVVMRLAMVSLWLRAARHDTTHRRACLTYAVVIFVAQMGWSALAIASPGVGPHIGFALLLMLVEMSGPALAERMDGGTPWHSHHMSERHGLLAIIALGEGVVGTVASVSAIVETHGWSVDAILICAAGVGLTFGMWWTYFVVSFAEVLDVHRRRAFVWGYGHIIIFASIAAMGAGLHVAAYVIQGKAHIGATAATLSVAIPVAAFLLMVYALYAYMLRARDAVHIALLALTGAVLGGAVAMSANGFSLTHCLMLLTLAPIVTVIGYETFGHRHAAEALARETTIG